MVTRLDQGPGWTLDVCRPRRASDVVGGEVVGGEVVGGEVGGGEVGGGEVGGGEVGGGDGVQGDGVQGDGMHGDGVHGDGCTGTRCAAMERCSVDARRWGARRWNVVAAPWRRAVMLCGGNLGSVPWRRADLGGGTGASGSSGTSGHRQPGVARWAAGGRPANLPAYPPPGLARGRWRLCRRSRRCWRRGADLKVEISTRTLSWF